MTAGGRWPSAVVCAEAGAEQWRAAAHAQRTAISDHGDFYAVAGELVATLRSLEALAEVLGRRVAGYGQGRVLRDDAGWDPSQRLVEAVGQLIDMGQALNRAERAANGFWSAIGHIAVEVP